MGLNLSCVEVFVGKLSKSLTSRGGWCNISVHDYCKKFHYNVVHLLTLMCGFYYSHNNHGTATINITTRMNLDT